MKTWCKGLMGLTVVVFFAACGGGTTSEPGTTDDSGGATDDAGVSDTGADTGSGGGSDTTLNDTTKTDVQKDIQNGCTSAAQCNDNDPCTDDGCGADGKCTHVQNGKPCDDGDNCTTGDHCQAGVCQGSGQCEDIVQDVADTSNPGDASTGDTGPATNCSQAEWDSMQNEAFITQASTCGQGCLTNPNAAQCISDCLKSAYNLSDTCGQCYTGLATCVSGKCLTECALGATSANCKNCAAKNCGNALSTCAGHPAPNCGEDVDCNDNSVCTTDSCVNMFCVHTAIPCDDGNACTADSCDLATGCTATALPDSVTCDDGNVCTEGDNCGTGTCAGKTKDCNDGNPCTDDACDLAGACTYTAHEGTCDDGNICTVGDTCVALACTGTASDAPCNDDNACTGDVCDVTKGASGADVACSHGVISCEDGNACTSDSCDSGSGCANLPLSDTACDDSNGETVFDTCTAGTCVGTVPDCLIATDCDDENDCTLDACDQATYTCKHDLAPNTCIIEGGCYAAGAQGNTVCLACDPTASTSTWTAANESGVCGEGGICASGTCVGNWPPSLTSLADGKTCTLPTCDAGSKLPFDSTGNWVVTTETVSTTCGYVVSLVEPQANVGHKKTGKAHGLNFAGGCDYAQGGTTTQVGTFISNSEVTCEVHAQDYGVTSVEVGQVSFASGLGEGTGIATLYDLPLVAGEPGNSCTITVKITVAHVPDCANNGDCDDGIACTTDACNTVAGTCSHTIDANTCLIDGQCIADGAYQSTTGNGSCRLCAGKFPSQNGWIVLSNGEPCDNGQGQCGAGGECQIF